MEIVVNQREFDLGRVEVLKKAADMWLDEAIRMINEGDKVSRTPVLRIAYPRNEVFAEG